MKGYLIWQKRKRVEGEEQGKEIVSDYRQVK